MSDEQKIMGCTPTYEGPSLVPDATEGTCRDCGTAVWLSPSSKRMMATDPLIVTVCIRCVETRLKQDPDNHDVRIHPLQVGELLAHFEGERRRN